MLSISYRFFSTGDREKAEEAKFLSVGSESASEPCIQRVGADWTRRTIIQSAIRLIAPLHSECAKPKSGLPLWYGNTCLIQAEVAATSEKSNRSSASFRMSALERYSDHECSILLGCAPRRCDRWNHLVLCSAWTVDGVSEERGGHRCGTLGSQQKRPARHRMDNCSSIPGAKLESSECIVSGLNDDSRASSNSPFRSSTYREKSGLKLLRCFLSWFQRANEHVVSKLDRRAPPRSGGLQSNRLPCPHSNQTKHDDFCGCMGRYSGHFFQCRRKVVGMEDRQVL